MKQEQTSPSQPSQVPLVEPVPLRRENSSRSTGPAAEKKLPKKWLAIFLLAFFLFGIIFIVPAENVPLVRSLAAALGFSVDETQQFSLARILAKWGREGFPSAAERAASRGDGQQWLFDKNNLAGENLQAGLIDWKAVNAARIAQGLPPESVFGVYSDANRKEENHATVSHAVTGWTAQAQQDVKNANVESGILFGEDGDLLLRRTQEKATAQGSAEMFQATANTNIVGINSSDWLGLAIDKAMEISVGNFDEELQRAAGDTGTIVNLNTSLTAADKARRDLARVWLLSKAANKAPQLMLKKQLAAAGYMSIEMPKKAYDSFGTNGGLMLNGNEISEDFQLTNKELLSEEQCRELVQSMSDTLNKSIQEAEGFLGPSGSLRQLPQCENASSVEEWKNRNISPLEEHCKQRQKMLNSLSKKCERKIKQAGTCQVSGTGYGNHVDQYKKDCDDLLLAKEKVKIIEAQLESATDEGQKAALESQLQAAKKAEKDAQEKVDEDSEPENVSSHVDETFFPGEGNTDYVGFFPEEDIKAALSDW